jgi:glycosyltransferase involved in cell wall biosynthesis
MPRVSVILTSFNHAKYLREAIDSVLNQSYSDLELIILDDVSMDDSWAVINGYSDARVMAIRSQANGEINLLAKHVVTDVASGEYIAIHHSDDVWELDKLAKQVAYLDRYPEVGAVFTSACAIGEDGLPLGDSSHFYFSAFDQPNRSRQEWLRYFFNHDNALCNPSVLIRKSCYGECGSYNKAWLWQFDDFDMWLRLLMRHDIHVMPEKLVRFRVRDDEANTSGYRRDSRIRSTYEYLELLDNYRSISSFDDLCAIFPEAKKYDRGDDGDLLFALGMVALELALPPYAKLFALELLQEAISDPVRSVAIKSAYGFGIKDFVRLTGEHDVFSLEDVAELRHGVAARDRRILDIHSAAFEREAQIANLTRGAVERDELILSLDSQLSECKARIVSLTQELAERDKLISIVQSDLAAHDDRLIGLDQESSK